MAHISAEELIANNKVLSDDHDFLMNSEELKNISLDVLLNWSQKDYYINLDKLKSSKGYEPITEIDVKDLQEESNVNCIKKQLNVRDEIIIKLHDCFQKTFNISYQSKMELNKLVKKKKQLLKIIKQLRRKSIKKVEKKSIVNCEDKSIQTESEESNNYDWNSYYSQYYNNYYAFENKCENASKNLENDSAGTALQKNEIFEDKFQDLNTISDDKNINEVDILENKSCKTENEDFKVENVTDSTDFNWNKVDVKEEVRELATEITEKLGFVFVDELDMYYDHSSGYYYDHKTSLYYDGKTGTYFYYNHETSKYEFYAQVNPEDKNSEEQETNKKKLAEEKEEGEYSESDELLEEEKEIQSKFIVGDDDVEIAPSLRLMIMNGKNKGSLHVVTVDGGILGREGNPQVLIKHPSVSKVHAELTYRSDGPDDYHYYLQDLGSVNGTFVRGERLSESKKKSHVVEIGHGWDIRLGDVVLCCHIHPGLLTCNECEPGLVLLSSDDEDESTGALSKEGPKGKLEKERRRQNKVIRKKFSINYFDPGLPITNIKYRDRAGKRREAVGSDNPYEKTQVASVDTNITRENKGFQLMEKMGWSEGQSLGVNDSGLTEPVLPVTTSGRMGLGCHAYSVDVDAHQFSNMKTKQRIMKNSKMNDSSSSKTPSDENSEKNRSIQSIKFTPSSDSSQIT